MTAFSNYKSLEEMLKDMREKEDAANSRLTKRQIELRDDTEHNRCWVRDWDGIFIFGDAWSHASCYESELRCGASKEEAYESTLSIIESRKRGYLFGIAFSVLEPRGEIGSTHVSQVVPIERRLFDLAKRCSWSILDPDKGKALETRIRLAILDWRVEV